MQVIVIKISQWRITGRHSHEDDRRQNTKRPLSHSKFPVPNNFNVKIYKFADTDYQKVEMQMPIPIFHFLF